MNHAPIKKVITVLYIVLLSGSLFAKQSDSLVNKEDLRAMKIVLNNKHIQKNNIKVNLWTIIVAGVEMTYERKITNFLSLQSGLSYFYRYSYEPMQVFNLNFQCRFYPLYRLSYAPKGLYIALSVGYATGYGHYGKYEGYRWDDPVFDALIDRWYHSPEIGMRAGYQFVWEVGIVLDLGLGWSAFPTAGKFPGSNTQGYIIPTFITSLGFNF